MSDLISRQAAMDALMAILDRPNHAEFLYTDEICKALNELSSAQPAPCEDAVSRKVIMRHYDSGEYKHVNHISRNGLLDYIEQLPSAQPEQSIAQERYEDLCEYFKDCSDQGRSILNDRKEFKSWLDRMKWHVMECNRLGRELEKLKSVQTSSSCTHENDSINRQSTVGQVFDDDCVSRQAAIDGKICIQRANGVEIYDDYAVPVEYLEQLPSTNCSEFPNSSDTISRQAAIDALETVGYDFSESELSEVELEEVCGTVSDVKQDMIDRIKQLPSAQETHEERTATHACDLISRQAVIDLLKQMRKDGNMVPWEGKDVFARIRKLPSAQPERKRGKWLLYAQRDGIETGSECSQCGYHIYIPPQYGHNFCPNCGAKMEESEDIPMEYFESGGM